MLFNVLILFCLIFSFPLPAVGNSLLLSLVIATPKVLLSSKRRKYFYSIICNKYVLTIITLAFLLSILSFFYVILLGTYDFEKSYSLLSQILTYFIASIVLSSLYNYERDYSYICKCIIIVFLIQSLIQIIAFLSPEIRNFIKLFQFPGDTLVAEYYGGIRGLSVSGRLFFELAASYGLIFFLYLKYFYDNNIYTYKYVFGFILIFIGSFFVGRTSIIAFGIALIFFLFYTGNRRTKLKIIVKIIFSLLLLGLIIFFFLPGNIKDILLNKLLPWVFELVYKYFETGHAQSNSLDTLESMYSIDITDKEWIIGSGIYTNPDGTYYKFTDSGYLRQILFWGLLGSFLNFVYMLSFFYYPIKNNLKNKNELLFLGILLIYILILHYKGELMGHSRFFLSLLFIYLVKYNEKWRLKRK